MHDVSRYAALSMTISAASTGSHKQYCTININAHPHALARLSLLLSCLAHASPLHTSHRPEALQEGAEHAHRHVEPVQPNECIDQSLVHANNNVAKVLMGL